MLDLGPHAGFEPLGLVQQLVQLALWIERFALAWPHGHMPLGLAPLHLLALVHALVTRIAPGVLFLAMQQPCRLRYVIEVGRRTDDRVYQA